MSRPESELSERPAGRITRLRRWLRPVHPNRLRAAALHGIHRLGWFRLRLWLGGLSPRRLLLSGRWWLDARGRRRRRRREERLTVAVDISALWQPLTGVGWYLYRLLEVMAERDDVRLRLYGPGLVVAGDLTPPHRPLPSGRALEVVSYEVPEDFSVVRSSFAAFLRRRSGRLIEADGNQVLFAPNYLLPDSFRDVGGAEVAVVHDLSAYVVPQTMRESTLGELKRDLASAIARSTRLITDSATVRAELIAANLADAEKIDVAPLAPAFELCKVPQATPVSEASESLPTPGSEGGEHDSRYVLFVGTLEPRKNLQMLIEAFARYRRSEGAEPVELVICGGIGWKAKGILELLGQAEKDGFVRHVGYAADDELSRLYHQAEWVVLPSLYEGFGLPVVEAMAVGVPLLLSDIPVLREVAAEAALYAPPEDSDAWVELFATALANPAQRAEVARHAEHRGRLFSWQATADATVASWRQAVEDRRWAAKKSHGGREAEHEVLM